MRERLQKIALGYSIPAADALFEDLEERLISARADQERILEEIQASLSIAEASCTNLEGDIHRLHEVRAADLATLTTITDLRSDMVRQGQTVLEATELRLLTRLTRLQIQLGERRQRLATFQRNVRRVIDAAMTPVSVPVPSPAAKESRTSAPTEVAVPEWDDSALFEVEATREA